MNLRTRGMPWRRLLTAALAAVAIFLYWSQTTERGQREAARGPSVRILDVSALAAVVEKRIHALRHGVTDVHILNARRPHSLIEELFTDGGVGTVCRLRSRTGEEA